MASKRKREKNSKDLKGNRGIARNRLVYAGIFFRKRTQYLILLQQVMTLQDESPLIRGSRLRRTSFCSGIIFKMGPTPFCRSHFSLSCMRTHRYRLKRNCLPLFLLIAGLYYESVHFLHSDCSECSSEQRLNIRHRCIFRIAGRTCVLDCGCRKLRNIFFFYSDIMQLLRNIDID